MSTELGEEMKRYLMSNFRIKKRISSSLFESLKHEHKSILYFSSSIQCSLRYDTNDKSLINELREVFLSIVGVFHVEKSQKCYSTGKVGREDLRGRVNFETILIAFVNPHIDFLWVFL
jgi:hypothetical protein